MSKPILEGVLNRMFWEKADEVNRKVGSPNKDYYKVIPISITLLIKELEMVENLIGRKRCTTFLDVGCGIGNVMRVSEEFDFSVYGVEYNRKLKPYLPYRSSVTTKLSTEIIIDKYPIEHNRIALCDALSFESYSIFDIVYLFRPIRDKRLEMKLERLVENSLKIGAFYICNYKQSPRIFRDTRFEKVSEGLPIWRKMRA